MTHVAVQVTLAAVSGVSEDSVVNTYHVDASALDELTTEGIALMLETFYGDMANYISNLQSRAAGNLIKFFDMTDPEPRVPIREREFTFSGTGGATPLPTECAICVSFAATPESGTPAGRRRGRVYIGPLSNNTVATVDGSARVTATCRSDFADAATTLVTQLGADDFAPLQIYSRADAVIRPVTSGWVDNAIDIQRRRGVRATARSPIPNS